LHTTVCICEVRGIWKTSARVEMLNWNRELEENDQANL
jgi:hypothetical protein